MDRSYNKFEEEHVNTLRKLALEELERMLNQMSGGKYKVFENKLISICLCQGVAQHIVESKGISEYDHIDYVPQNEIEERNFKISNDGQVLSGIKDVDVWFFFEEDDKVKIPDIKNMRKSISVNFEGIGIKKIDFLKKGVGKAEDGYSALTPKQSVIKYITSKGTSTANHLKRKSIIGLFPDSVSGEIFWSVKRVVQA